MLQMLKIIMHENSAIVVTLSYSKWCTCSRTASNISAPEICLDPKMQHGAESSVQVDVVITSVISSN